MGWIFDFRKLGWRFCFFRIFNAFVFTLKPITWTVFTSFFQLVKDLFLLFPWQLTQNHGFFSHPQPTAQSINSLRLLTKSSIKFSGSLVYKKIGLSIRIDDLETEIGTCFLIQFVVCVDFSSCVGTQTHAKFNFCFRLLKNFLAW